MRWSLLAGLVLVLSGCLSSPAAPVLPTDDLDEPEAFDPGWPDLAAAPLRPGAKLYDNLQDQTVAAQHYQCTLSFVFSDLNNTTLYVSTASHCVAGFAPGDPLPLADGAGQGTLVYCSFAVIEETGSCPNLGISASESGANDFALIEIDTADRDKVHPALFGVGGPTGMAPRAAKGDIAYTYGNSDFRDARVPAVPDAMDARAGRVWANGEWIVEVLFDVSSVGGDSGSPVIDGEGRALGVMQYVGSEACPGPRPDVNGVVYLQAALDFMHNHTDLEVELKTWSLLETLELLPDAPWPCSSTRGGAAPPTP